MLYNAGVQPSYSKGHPIDLTTAKVQPIKLGSLPGDVSQ